MEEKRQISYVKRTGRADSAEEMRGFAAVMVLLVLMGTLGVYFLLVISDAP